MKTQLEEAARLHANGDLAAATALYRKILAQSPREAEALHMMGIIAQQGNNPELALKFIELALAANPDFANAWHNRGIVLHALNRDEEALQSLQAAVDIAPGLAAAWDMIGQLLKKDGAYMQARDCHIRAIALQPANPLFYDNYAALLLAIHDLTEAYRAARRAESFAPYLSTSLGSILKAMGYPEQAAAHFARLGSRLSCDAEVTATEAMARLQTGDWERGWSLWEKRPYLGKKKEPISEWAGEATPRLLLYEDQGIGDALQFLRYLPLLKNRAAAIILRVRSPLQRLCTENFSDSEIITEDAPLTEPLPSARCRLSSLPFFFATRLNNIPSPPYLSAPDERRVFWRNLLRDFPPPRIGLVWAGGAGFRMDAARSMKAGMLSPLIACGAAHFVSLQKDRDDKMPDIFDASPLLHDFADTAALIAELDLVITVDTAIAHLAGALGKPVWIFLPFDSDWRWLLGREDSPWYPSARLFRQEKPNDWTPVIENVKCEMQKLIAGDPTVLRAKPWNGESLRQNPNALPLPL